MPSVRLAVALPVLRVARPYGPGAPPIIAAAPGAGTTRWPSWSCCRPNTRPGSLHCQRRSRTRPPPRRCTQSATSTSQTSKRSSRREASAGIKPARLCGTVGDRLSRQHHQHRSRKDVGAARRPYAYGAGPTGSADPNQQGGPFWTPIGGPLSMPIDTRCCTGPPRRRTRPPPTHAARGPGRAAGPAPCRAAPAHGRARADRTTGLPARGPGRVRPGSARSAAP